MGRAIFADNARHKKKPTCMSMCACHVPDLVLKYFNNFSVGWSHNHGALVECQNRFEH